MGNSGRARYRRDRRRLYNKIDPAIPSHERTKNHPILFRSENPGHGSPR